ncbi:MAG: hypothetical protein AAGI01_18190, partial [Myxococcota bacterium]
MTRHAQTRIAVLLVLGVLGCDEAQQEATLSVPAARGELTFTGVYYGELHAAKSVPLHVPNIPGTWQMTVDSV